jgi:hypothetical protein
MAKVKGNAYFQLTGADDGAITFEIDADEVAPDYIPATYKEVPVLTDPPLDLTVPVLDETGSPVMKKELLTDGRYETQEEAVLRVLRASLEVDELETSGITSLTFSVEYTTELELTFEGYELEDFGDEYSPEDIDEDVILQHFEEEILDAAIEDLKYGAPDFRVTQHEAE